MSATNAFETSINTLIFNNTDAANIGDAAGLQNSATAGSFYVSLHTADPGETGTQTTSETAYTGYARIAVARSGAGWTCSGATASNAAAILFGTCTASPGAAVTHFGLGSDVSGAGNLFFSGALGSSYTVAVSNAPNFAIAALVVTTD
jgi:hypothetical protein